MPRVWQGGAELQSGVAGVEVGAVTGPVGVSTTTKRSGAAAWRFNPSAATSYWANQMRSADGPLVATAWLYVATFPSTNATVVSIVDASASTIGDVQVDQNGTLTARTAPAGTISTRGTTTISTGQWYCMQIHVTATLHEVRLNGTIVGTNQTGTTLWEGRDLRVGIQAAASADIYADDVMVNDTSGEWQSTTSRIVHVLPDSAGDNAGWTLGAGTGANWALVAEVTPNDLTSYAKRSSGTPTDDHSAQSASSAGIGASDTISCVAVGWRQGANSTTATGRTGVLRIKSQPAGTVAESASLTMNVNGFVTHTTTGAKTYQLVRTTRPQDGAAWTVADIGALQAGYRANASSTNEIRVSTVWVSVEYVPGGGSTTLAGSAAVGGAGGLAPAGVLYSYGPHALGGAGGFASGGLPVLFGPVGPGGAGGLTSGGLQLVRGSPGVGGSGGLTPGSTLLFVLAAGALGGAGTLGGGGVVVAPGSSSMGGAGALASGGLLLVPGSPALGGAGGISAVTLLRMAGALGLGGSGGLQVVVGGPGVMQAALSMGGAGGLASNGILRASGSAVFSGSGGIGSSGLLILPGARALGGAATLGTGATTVLVLGGVAVGGAAGLSAVAQLVAGGGAVVGGSGALMYIELPPNLPYSAAILDIATGTVILDVATGTVILTRSSGAAALNISTGRGTIP